MEEEKERNRESAHVKKKESLWVQYHYQRTKPEKKTNPRERRNKKQKIVRERKDLIKSQGGKRKENETIERE